MKSTVLAKKLRAEDIQHKTGSCVVSNYGNFQANILEALKIKEENLDIPRPRGNQIQLFPKKWQGTIVRAQFFFQAH